MPIKHGAGTAREKLSISWWDGLSYSGSFTFDKFSEQRHRAVFRCDRPSDRYTSNLFKTLKDQELLQKVMMKPYHQMSMRQRINHIPLPDLIVDVVDHTLALDWRQLFSRFFTEEKKKFVVGMMEIDGGQKIYSNSGGVSRLCMYSSASHISETGVQITGTPE